MGNWFDDLSKALGSGMARRDTFRWIGGAGMATVLTSLGFKNAWAAPAPPAMCGKSSDFSDPCFDQTVCSEEPFCTCLPRVQANAALCHEPVSCEGLVPCDSDSDCTAAGLSGQWRCAYSCCSNGFEQAFCHPRCGSGEGAFTMGARIPGGRTSIGGQ